MTLLKRSCGNRGWMLLSLPCEPGVWSHLLCLASSVAHLVAGIHISIPSMRITAENSAIWQCKAPMLCKGLLQPGLRSCPTCSAVSVSLSLQETISMQ